MKVARYRGIPSYVHAIPIHIVTDTYKYTYVRCMQGAVASPVGADTCIFRKRKKVVLSTRVVRVTSRHITYISHLGTKRMRWQHYLSSRVAIVS